MPFTLQYTDQQLQLRPDKARVSRWLGTVLLQAGGILVGIYLLVEYVGLDPGFLIVPAAVPLIHLEKVAEALKTLFYKDTYTFNNARREFWVHNQLERAYDEMETIWLVYVDCGPVRSISLNVKYTGDWHYEIASGNYRKSLDLQELAQQIARFTGLPLKEEHQQSKSLFRF